MTNNYEDDTTGEPDALKGARPVRKGTERKGLVTIPRSQSTLHRELHSQRLSQRSPALHSTWPNSYK